MTRKATLNDRCTNTNPVVLVFTETTDRMLVAIARELQIKAGPASGGKR